MLDQTQSYTTSRNDSRESGGNYCIAHAILALAAAVAQVSIELRKLSDKQSPDQK